MNNHTPTNIIVNSKHLVNESAEINEQLSMYKEAFTYAANTQAYYNAPYGIHDIVHGLLRPVYAARFWMLYKICRAGKDVFNFSYSYLSKIFNCCVRTAERTINYLDKMGFIHKTQNIVRGWQQANTYKLKIPLEKLDTLMNSAKRALPEPQINYSIEHEVEGVEVGEYPGPIIKSRREIPKAGDTRGLLDLKVSVSKGPLSKMLGSIKDKLSTVKPEEEPKTQAEPYYGWGTPDINVVPNILNNKIYNKTDPKTGQSVNVCNKKKKKRSLTRKVSAHTLGEIEEYVYSNRDISAPRDFCKEIEYFISTNPQIHEAHALNSAKELIRDGLWSTPWGMRY